MFRFGQIEAVLQHMHSVPEEGRSQFRAKLRHLFRVGLSLPSGRVGRRANYGYGDLLMMAFAAELLQAGIPPEKAVLLVGQSWPDFIETMFVNRKWDKEGRPHWSYLVAEPRAMTGEPFRLRAEVSDSLSARLAADPLDIRRLLIINPGTTLNDIGAAVHALGLDRETLEAALDKDQATILAHGARVFSATKGVE